MGAPLSLVAQGAMVLAALMLAIFAPSPGTVSLFVPIGAVSSDEAQRRAAVWATKENALLVAHDRTRRTVTVIAPTTLSLMGALNHGFLPLAASAPSCAPVS